MSAPASLPPMTDRKSPKLYAVRRSPIHGRGVFAGLPDPFTATRYHSLVIKPETCPACLEVTAMTKDNEIMAVAHREFPIWGVQFHPESILTPNGKQLLRNFLALRK